MNNDVFKYIFFWLMVPLGVFVLCAFSGFWWAFESEQKVEFVQGTLMLLMLYALVYEMGYQKIYRIFRMQKYFFIVLLLPAVVATLGYGYGLWLRSIDSL